MVKSQLEKTSAADKKLAREKLTEMRLKKKRRLRGLRGNGDDDEEQVAVLGGSSEDDQQSEAPEEESEEEAPVVIKKASVKKANKRVRVSDVNEEERALALLGNDDF